jgi:hypothetical protein
MGTGRNVFDISFQRRSPSSGWYTSARDIVNDAVRPVYAIKPGASGDITLKADQKSNQYISWYLPRAGLITPHRWSTATTYYTLLDRGFVTCHDAKTGKESLRQAAYGPGGRRIHVFTLGLQRQDASASVKTGTLSSCRRDLSTKLLGKNSLDEMCYGDAGHRERKSDYPDGLELYRISKN